MIDKIKESDKVSTSNNELPSSQVKTSQPIQVKLEYTPPITSLKFSKLHLNFFLYLL